MLRSDSSFQTAELSRVQLRLRQARHEGPSCLVDNQPGTPAIRIKESSDFVAFRTTLTAPGVSIGIARRTARARISGVTARTCGPDTPAAVSRVSPVESAVGGASGNQVLRVDRSRRKFRNGLRPHNRL